MRRQLAEFYHLTKPGIVYGNIVHTLAGSFLAYQYGLDAATVIGVVVGTSLVIASACVANNYIDRGIDAKMIRTKTRALAEGRTTLRGAAMFSALLFFLGFATLYALTNPLVVLIGLVAYVFYVLVYAYAKRRTVHSTLIGSIPGALPAMAGYVAISGVIDTSSWLVFFLIVCWQMAHFYAISIFRRHEYKAAGLPVLGVVAPFSVVKANIAIFMISYAVVIATLNKVGTISTLPTLMLLAGAGYWYIVFSRQSLSADAWGLRVFRASLLLPLLLLAATMLNVVLSK